MEHNEELNRRGLVKAVGAGALGVAAMAAVGAAEEKPKAKGKAKGERKIRMPKNSSYYKDGKFDVEAGKDAILKLMAFHKYPIFENTRESLWVADYGLGEFTTLGLAAHMFMNNEDDRYMLMDLFLVPGQMLPEHWHLATDKNPAKREGWLVRCGLSNIVGIGEETPGIKAMIPKSQKKHVTTFHSVAATPGTFVPLAEVESRHWQLAGPNGAIITEVANVHDDKGVRHTCPAANDWFLNPPA